VDFGDMVRYKGGVLGEALLTSWKSGLAARARYGFMVGPCGTYEPAGRKSRTDRRVILKRTFQRSNQGGRWFTL